MADGPLVMRVKFSEVGLYNTRRQSWNEVIHVLAPC